MNLLEVIDAFESGLMKVCLAMLAAVVVGCAGAALYRAALRSAVARWRLLPWLEWAPLACLCAVCIVLGGEKTRGLPQAGGGPITAEEIAQGYRLEGVVTNDATSYVLPTNGVTYMPWSLRGGRETRFALDLGGFSFPFGTGVVRRVDVLSGGMVESLPRPSLAAICAAREWASLIPGESRFWWADADGGAAKLLTWEDVCAGRDRTEVYSAQIELRGNGDFTTRSNNVERVYRRVPYFDWDDDGLENSVDPEPDVAGPDAHGTNAEWYNTVCSNVLEAVATSCDPPVELTWLGGVNSNAYYFVDVVAERGPAPIWFTGDRASRLGDPVVVARAGETNRVPLLIGVDYAVTSDTPFSVSFPVDYMYPEVETNEPCVAHIHWPLEFHFVETNVTGATRIYRVDVGPFDPGGVFSWEMRSGGSSGGMPLRGGGCECVSFAGRDVSFCCSANCGCSGSCEASGTYDFECASFPVSGGGCRCGFVEPDPPAPPPPPEQPSFSVSFSDSAVIFEDTYQDEPGVWKPRRSTRVWVSVSATGGTHGGSFTLVTENLGKLVPVACEPMVFPPSMTVGPYGTYCASFLCEGASQSDSAGDVRMSGTFIENETGASFSSSNRLTVVKVEIKEKVIAIGNPSVHRHRYGIGEEVQCLQKPAIPSVLWGTTGNGSFSSGSETLFLCPMRAEEFQLLARCSDTFLPIPISVIEPEAIVCDYAEFLPPVAGGNGCGMLLRLLVVPFTVSFRNLKIQEVPADLGNWQQWGSHDGYFSDYAFYQYWCHSTFWGAGVWRSVDEFCSLGFDESRMLNWPQPWSEGHLSWKIPYGWKHKDSTSSVCVGQIAPPSYSTWTMNTNFIEKAKHDRRIGVSLSGQMFFEGVLQNENQ